jgi:hypothetical protein
LRQGFGEADEWFHGLLMAFDQSAFTFFR